LSPKQSAIERSGELLGAIVSGDGGKISLHLCFRSIQSTHAPTHSSYTMEILDVFKLDKEVEDKQVLQFKSAHA
jgi:hypothetical protein